MCGTCDVWAGAYYNILLDDRAGLGQALETLNAVLTRIEEVKV